MILLTDQATSALNCSKTTDMFTTANILTQSKEEAT
jgi:hypothetical protein